MKWNESQVQFLKENYGKINFKQITLHLGKSDNAIRQMAAFLKINKINYNIWTDDELKILCENYPYKFKSDIKSLFPLRKWVNIVNKANELGLIRIQKNKERIMGNCSILLKNIPESFYWIGFLLADGHFSKENRLTLKLSIKDNDHLIKFSKFLGSNYTQNKMYVSTSIMDKITISQVKSKFDISNIKTYCPPDLDLYKSFPDDNIISLIIGYIDGDGCIKKQTNRNDCLLQIKLHASWLKFLYFIKEFLEKYFKIVLNGIPKINNKGYSIISIANSKLLGLIKRKAIELNLPFLERKWKLIDENKISRCISAIEKKKYILKLHNEGYKLKDIKNKTNISMGYISRIINHYNYGQPLIIGKF